MTTSSNASIVMLLENLYQHLYELDYEKVSPSFYSKSDDLTGELIIDSPDGKLIRVSMHWSNGEVEVIKTYKFL